MSNELAIKSTNDIIFSPSSMQQMSQIATMMASSDCTVPKHLQGNVGDCFAIAMQAAQWGMNPFAVAQKTHLVSGTLGYEAQLVNAVIASLAPTKGRLQFKWEGDWSKVIGNFKEIEGKNGKYRKLNSTLADEKGCYVRVWATMNDETEPRVLELFLSQAGVRNSTLWADDPKQQLAYLAIKRWARLYCPDVLLGVYSADELDTIPSEIEINPMAREESNSSSVLTCDELIFNIRSMSVEDFKLVDPVLYTDDERASIRKAMTERKKIIADTNKSNVVADVVAEVVATAHLSITDRINACTSAQELNNLIVEINDESVELEHDALIGEKYDSFR